MFCWECVNKLRLWYEGTLKYPGESLTGTEIRLRKRWRGLDAFIVFRDSGMDASRCTDKRWCFWCACAVVFPMEDQSRQSWCHEMTSQGSLMLLREGTIKGEHIQTSGLSSGSSDTECLGLLTSHRPSTLGYLSASCGAEHNQNGLCDLFIHMHVPRPFWGTFSQCDFSCLTLAG